MPLAWSPLAGGSVAIIGTQNAERIRASLASLDVQLDRTDLYAIVQASDGAPLP